MSDFRKYAYGSTEKNVRKSPELQEDGDLQFSFPEEFFRSEQLKDPRSYRYQNPREEKETATETESRQRSKITREKRRAELLKKRKRERNLRLALFTFLILGTVIGIIAVISLIHPEPEKISDDPETETNTADPAASKETDGTESITETEEPTADASSSAGETLPDLPPAGYLMPVPGVFQNPQGPTWIPSWITQCLLTVSSKNRPGRALSGVNNIVIHWVANPMSSAQNNRDYFEDLANPKANPEGTAASAHFVVGLYGDIVQCVPVNEVAFANYPRNDDTISIEVCHPDWEGKYAEKTYWAVVKLAAFLCEQYGLQKDDVIRHHDVSGKDCPKYYVNHPEAFEGLKNAIGNYMIEHPDIKTEFP